MNFLRRSPVLLELKNIEKEEEKLRKHAEQENGSKWKEALEERIPQKVLVNLKKAFGKAFELVFEKGTGIIEKTYPKEEMEKDFQIQDYAFELKGKRKELKKMKAASSKRNLKNLTISTVEGAGLGFLGIGLPDIVVFTGMILKGTYETALHYGFAYDTLEERSFLLKLLEASVSKGEAWKRCNEEADRMIEDLVSRQSVSQGQSLQQSISEGQSSRQSVSEGQPSRQSVSQGQSSQQGVAEQLAKTADAFAMDMLAVKFIQGLPIIGIAGGLSNPVYYSRIMKYVQIKYRKRYLQSKIEKRI